MSELDLILDDFVIYHKEKNKFFVVDYAKFRKALMGLLNEKD